MASVKTENTLSPIRKVSVSQATFDTLLNNIMSGTWKQGEKIPSENELREQLGVSRHTIRSAITNLNMLGILETHQGEGSYVLETGVAVLMDFLIPYLLRSNTDVSAILEFRESIESTAARYAALRADDQDIEDIQKKMLLCEQHKDDYNQYPTYDFDFHLAIAEASKSDLLIQSMYIVKKYCFTAIMNYFDEKLVHQGTDFYHTRIFEAIKDHNPDAACNTMDMHIRDIIRTIEEKNQ